MQKSSISGQTRANWLIDVVVFIGAVLASLSGIYFLYLPSGGYMGGRNPSYGVTILFQRITWDHIHTWGSILMIAGVLVHLLIHWQWVKRMVRRSISGMLGKSRRLSRGGRFNVFIDLVVAVSFILTASSGVYFLFAPAGGFHNWEANLLFSRTTWDLIHTWSGVVMIVAAVIHFAIHWRWVENVTKRFFQSPAPTRRLEAGEQTGTMVTR